ncbi:hypothetical protein KEM56_000978 [Ascosphaera pollenicola]|nr:hypothetical protein KEM56_000978 [Ascosphaera pollenicola]
MMLYEQSQLVDAAGRLGLMEVSEVTLQAILTVCHHLYVRDDDDPRSLAGHGGPFSNSVLLSHIIPSAAESILSLVDTMIGHLGSKTSLLAKGTREYGFASMITVTVKNRLWPQYTTSFEEEASRRFRDIANGLLALSETEVNDQASGSAPVSSDEKGVVDNTTCPVNDVNADAFALQATGFEGMELSPDWLDFYLQQEDMDLKVKGNELFKEGDYVGAEECYTQAIAKDAREHSFYSNRSLCRLKLQYFVGAEEDARRTLDLLAPKNSPQRIKSQYVLAQALIGQNRAQEAYEVALPAYHQAIELKNSNAEPLSRVILEAKKGIWQVKETARLREENETLQGIEAMLENETTRQLAELQTSYDAGECGRIAFLEDQDALRRELKQKIETVRQVFADAKGGRLCERVVPDYLIDQITFEIMHDPVITKSGHSFERAVITRHLQKHPHDPITREQMTVSDLRPNYALKTACEEFLGKNGWAVDCSIMLNSLRHVNFSLLYAQTDTYTIKKFRPQCVQEYDHKADGYMTPERIVDAQSVALPET